MRLTSDVQTLEHHYSIAYGRPPIIHEDTAIANHMDLTSSPTTPRGDIRLHCQVGMFIILTRAYHLFGPDVDLEVPEVELPLIDRFNADIDKWKDEWEPRLCICP